MATEIEYSSTDEQMLANIEARWAARRKGMAAAQTDAQTLAEVKTKREAMRNGTHTEEGKDRWR